MPDVVNDPRLFLQIPDVTGDGVADFVIAHLNPKWPWSSEATAYVYNGTLYRGKSSIEKAATNELLMTVDTNYEDLESTGDGADAIKTHGRGATLKVKDTAGVWHGVNIFVSDYAYDNAEANLAAVVTKWDDYIKIE
jgi:hypothetical protein